MRIIGLPKGFYKTYKYAVEHQMFSTFREKYETPIRRYEYLRKTYKISFEDLAKEFGFSRATFYRYRRILSNLDAGKPISFKPQKRYVKQKQWGQKEIDLVLKIRRENPTYGKFKIYHILKRDYGFTLSESTVGRVLKLLMAKGIVTKSISCTKVKRKRKFNKHAKPLKFKKYDKMKLGENVQIDHMTVTRNGISFKHFQAWERKSKMIVAQIYSQARSLDAEKFLEHLLKTAPYKVLSIQVDGGSEFMKDFEKACAKHKIPLYVLPPATPKYNGGVERGNKIFREEFYADPNLLEDTLNGMRIKLQQAVKKYNEYRPHNSLHGLTPLCYIKQHSETNSSHPIWTNTRDSTSLDIQMSL